MVQHARTFSKITLASVLQDGLASLAILTLMIAHQTLA
jgi:hypothetical protein